MNRKVSGVGVFDITDGKAPDGDRVYGYGDGSWYFCYRRRFIQIFCGGYRRPCRRHTLRLLLLKLKASKMEMELGLGVRLGIPFLAVGLGLRRWIAILGLRG